MKLLYLVIAFFFSSFVLSQEVEKGTAFVIEFVDVHNNMDFRIVSKKTFNGIVDFSKTSDSIFKSQPKENQIIVFFADEKTEERITPTLVLVSGINGYVNYELMIKPKSEKKFINTSTLFLAKNLKSFEIWSFPIQAIKFNKFNIIEEERLNKFQFKVKIDSTCINNANRNIEVGQAEFKFHLKSVIDKFKNTDDFTLEQMMSYERTINSEDKSLGHFWSLGEGIYPNKNKFKFGNPVSYRRVECPYFENRVNYFYTKKEKDIKIVSFSWNAFEESNMGSNDEISNDIDYVFNEKFEFVLNAVTQILGTPIENVTDTDGQRHIRWKSKKGVNAYLFNFSDYPEIRLYIYKK